MGFISNLFTRSDKVHITNDDNIYNLSENESKIEELIKEKGPILTKLSINPEYIVRMIYYIESLYRSGLSIINDENDLIKCINKDCVLFEMMIDLPPPALEKNGRNSIYAQIHYNKRVFTIDDILYNPGYIWYIYKSLNNETSDSLKHAKFEEYKNLNEYKAFIEVYVYLINIYTKKKFENILNYHIFERLKKIYSGLIMLLSKITNDTIVINNNFIRNLFDKRELDKIDLGKIFIGYQNMHGKDDGVSLVVFDTKKYKQKSLTELYVDLHNTVRQIESIPKNF